MNKSESKWSQEGFEIQVDAHQLARFANQVMIGHDPESFELRFLYIAPGTRQGVLVAHIILTPPHAKRLLAALQDNIQKYESTFGPIPEQILPMGPAA